MGSGSDGGEESDGRGEEGDPEDDSLAAKVGSGIASEDLGNGRE